MFRVPARLKGTLFFVHRNMSLSKKGPCPPRNPGMKDLDRSFFQKAIPVLAARVQTPKTSLILRSRIMRSFIMDWPRVRNVVSDPSDPEGTRLVLMKVTDKTDLSQEALQLLQAESQGLENYTINLYYDYWTADDIIQAILPEELLENSPTGFAITGHLAHMNLNEQYLPYKYLIGQVILDKNKAITTVVNKLDSIHDTFRFFDMELIAGQPNYLVEHHESGCRFTFDFTQVYWNSRLHTEHDRLVQLFRPEEVIVDVFAGIGPFAIPAAKKGCAVFANDLNPNSVKYLKKNVVDNRVDDLVRVFCEDGRDFIHNITARALEEPFPVYAPPSKRSGKKKEPGLAVDIATTAAVNATTTYRKQISHFVMNLPDSAIQFLDAFRSTLSRADVDRNLRGLYKSMPMVHCYCFTRELDPDKAREDIQKRVEEKLRHHLSEEFSLHLVRSVSPKKDMYCISFRLPVGVAFAE